MWQCCRWNLQIIWPAVYICAQETADKHLKNTWRPYDVTWPVIFPQNICAIIPNSITRFGEKLLRAVNKQKIQIWNEYFRNAKMPHLQFEQINCQQSARQHTKQMEKLCTRHQYITRTHQIIIGYNRFIIRMMQKCVTRYNRCIPIWHVPRMQMNTIMKIIFRMFFRIIVNITKVNV